MLETLKKTIKTPDGVSLHYDSLGTSKKGALVLLHGLGGDLGAWDHERRLLADLGYTSYAIDLRGHGLSDKPSTSHSYAIPQFAADIAHIIRKEELESSILIGHCFGGMVALTTAALYPEGISSLILIDTSFKPPFIGNSKTSAVLLRKIAEIIANYSESEPSTSHINFAPFIGGGDFDPKRILSDITHTSLATYLQVCSSFLEFDGSELLKKIHIPTLVITGDKDRIFPPLIAEELSRRIIDSHVSHIPSGNHIVVLNNPKEVTDEVDMFIKSLLKS